LRDAKDPVVTTSAACHDRFDAPRPDRGSTDDHRTLSGPDISQDAHRNVRARPLEFDVDGCVVQLKLAQYNLVKGRGKPRVAEADRSRSRIEFDPKRGLNLVGKNRNLLMPQLSPPRERMTSWTLWPGNTAAG
jgi:hypothetical protein